MTRSTSSGMFGLIDDSRDGPAWSSLGSPQTMIVGTNGAVFRSGGDAHRAGVRLEGWNTEPGPRDGNWDTEWDGEMTLTSGELRLVTVASGVSEQTVRIGSPGAYEVRVHCRGREAGVLANYDEVFEHWLMRFWPR